jgi:hypothetical protein
MVELYGYRGFLGASGWGLNYSASVDLAAGYQFPLAYLEINNNDNLIINPLLFLELASHNFFEIVTPYFVPRV